MIFLGNLKKITEKKYSIGCIHYMPFDSENGLGKSKEELIEEGILIEHLPPKMIEKKGKMQELYFIDEQLQWQYKDIPKSKQEQQQELNAKLLKDSANMQIELNKQKELNSTLLLKIAQLGGNANA